MIELKNVSKSYSGKQALNDVSLTLPQGEIVCLFGENGAGKTTLMKCILGFLRYQGTITLDGQLITSQNIARLSFATAEHSFFPNLSPKAHADFYRDQFPSFRGKRFKALMEFFELPMNKAVGSFSLGQKNQFEVIMALSQGADYILMDEPFAGNDVFNREDFYKVLLGILEPTETVLLSTHLIEEVSAFVGRAVLLRKGEIVGDTTTEALEDQGKSLMQYIKETYHYRSDRVSRALDELTRGENRGGISMRYTLCALVLSGTLALTGLCAAHHTLTEAQEQVLLTEITRQGDPTAALGASVELRSAVLDRMQWDTRWTVGQEPQTQFTFLPEASPSRRTDQDSVTLDWLGATSCNNMDSTSLQLGWLRKPLADLPLPTPEQPKVERTVPVAQYLNFYDLETAVQLAGKTIRELDTDSDNIPTASAARFLYDLEQAFSFPVRPDHKVKLTLQLEENGLTSLTAADVEGTNVQISTWSDSANGFIYFILEARTPDGQLWDYSHTAGYGIYRLPISGPLSIEDLELVSPLRENQKILHLSALSDNSALVLLTEEEHRPILHFLDGKTGQEIQAITLEDSLDTGWCSQALSGDTLFLRRDETHFSLLCRSSDGRWKLCLEDQIPQSYMDEQAFIQTIPNAFSWDGQRLLIADNTTNRCQFSLFLYDASGLRYWGDIRSSLSAGHTGITLDPHFDSLHASLS